MTLKSVEKKYNWKSGCCMYKVCDKAKMVGY